MNRARAVASKLALPLGVGAGVLFFVIGVSVLAFGWHRIESDFWPIDRSFVGPNLVASVVVVVLVLAHNEYRTIREGEARHESTKQLVRDAMNEALHPTETAEQNVADDVAAAERKR